MALIIGLAILFFALGFLSGHLSTYESEDAERLNELREQVNNLNKGYLGLRSLLPAELAEIFEGRRPGKIISAEEYFNEKNRKNGRKRNGQAVPDERGAAVISALEGELQSVREENETLRLAAAAKVTPAQEKRSDAKAREKRIKELEKRISEMEEAIQHSDIAHHEEIASLRQQLDTREADLRRAQETVADAQASGSRFDKYVGSRGVMSILGLDSEEELMRLLETEGFPEVSAAFGTTKLWLRKSIEEYVRRAAEGRR